MSRSPRFSSQSRLLTKQPTRVFHEECQEPDLTKLKELFHKMEIERNEFVKINQHLTETIQSVYNENDTLRKAIEDRKAHYELILDNYSKSIQYLESTSNHNKKMTKIYRSYKIRVNNIKKIYSNGFNSNEEMKKFQHEIDDTEKSATELMKKFPDSEQKVHRYQVLLSVLSKLMNINALFTKEALNCIEKNEQNRELFQPPNSIQFESLESKIKSVDNVKNEIPLVDNNSELLNEPKSDIERLNKKIKRCIPIYNQILFINEKKNFQIDIDDEKTDTFTDYSFSMPNSPLVSPRGISISNFSSLGEDEKNKLEVIELKKIANVGDFDYLTNPKSDKLKTDLMFLFNLFTLPKKKPQNSPRFKHHKRVQKTENKEKIKQLDDIINIGKSLNSDNVNSSENKQNNEFEKLNHTNKDKSNENIHITDEKINTKESHLSEKTNVSEKMIASDKSNESSKENKIDDHEKSHESNKENKIDDHDKSNETSKENKIDDHDKSNETSKENKIDDHDKSNETSKENKIDDHDKSHETSKENKIDDHDKSHETNKEKDPNNFEKLQSSIKEKSFDTLQNSEKSSNIERTNNSDTIQRSIKKTDDSMNNPLSIDHLAALLGENEKSDKSHKSDHVKKSENKEDSNNDPYESHNTDKDNQNSIITENHEKSVKTNSSIKQQNSEDYRKSEKSNKTNGSIKQQNSEDYRKSEKSEDLNKMKSVVNLEKSNNSIKSNEQSAKMNKSQKSVTSINTKASVQNSKNSDYSNETKCSKKQQKSVKLTKLGKDYIKNGISKQSLQKERESEKEKNEQQTSEDSAPLINLDNYDLTKNSLKSINSIEENESTKHESKKSNSENENESEKSMKSRNQDQQQNEEEENSKLNELIHNSLPVDDSEQKQKEEKVKENENENIQKNIDSQIEKAKLVNVETNTGLTIQMVRDRINEQRKKIEEARSKRTSKYDPSIFYTSNSLTKKKKRTHKSKHQIKLTITLKDIGLEGLDSATPDKTQELKENERRQKLRDE